MKRTDEYSEDRSAAFQCDFPESFEDVLSSLEKKIGQPAISVFSREVASAKTLDDLEVIVNKATGPSGLMEFMRVDLGEIASKGVFLGHGESPF